jgi:hypothetical protein
LAGGAAADTATARGGQGAALKVPPDGKATIALRDTDGAGKVTLWVYDDGSVAADPKARRVGPRWGIAQSDGRVLVAGVLYAPYLAGDSTYTIADSDGKQWFTALQYVGLHRTNGWHCWTFDFDAVKGLALSFDNKPIKRFDWNKTAIGGFAGLTILGDQAGADRPQTIWVDDVSVELGGVVQSKPTPPPPPPPVVPEKDPPLEGPPAKLLDAVRNQHPRLLFTAAKIPQLKAFYESAEGKPLKDQLLAYLPVCAAPSDNKCLTDATDAQRQGLWRLPTVALHYVLTGDAKSLDRTKGFLQWLLDLRDWETGEERNSGMGAANLMVGAALAFDWTYKDLDPAFRDKFRAKLVLQARGMYHGGHLMKNPGIHYWQSDPQNNHRWHRDAGLVLSALAACEDAPEEQWLLTKTLEEVKFVSDGLPADGTSHESPTYLVFGGQHLVMAVQAADECLGTRYLDTPFFRNLALFRVATLLPGLQGACLYGDCGGNGIGGYNNFFFKTASYHKQADAMDALRRLAQTEPKAFEFGWFSLVWCDPAVTGGNMEKLPLTTFWPDLGLALMREGWQDGGVAAMFKCGPFGGHALNAYRNANQFRYINVAHDDPDANSFTISAGKSLLAETDRYSKEKRSSHYNTILVNGMGQMVPGRGEGLGWSQPGSGDMSQMARVTAWKDSGDVVAVEGEAAGSYLAYTDRKTKQSRPALDRFRRTLIWVRGQYILALDDIRAQQPVDTTWLMQGPKLDALDAADGRYVLKVEKAACEFQLVADAPFQAEIADSPADDRGKPLGWRQLRATVSGKAVRFASVYAPWGRTPLKLALQADGAESATVTVSGQGLTDTWQWQAATARFTASTVRGKRQSGEFTLDAATAAPPAP